MQWYLRHLSHGEPMSLICRCRHQLHLYPNMCVFLQIQVFLILHPISEGSSTLSCSCQLDTRDLCENSPSPHFCKDQLLEHFPGRMILQHLSDLSYLMKSISLQLTSEKFLRRSSGSNHILFPAWFSQLVDDCLTNFFQPMQPSYTSW